MMRRTPIMLTVMLLLGACGGKKTAEEDTPALSVRDAAVRLAPVAGRPGSAYFTVHGGAAPDRLVAISSDKVATIELHENRMENGMMNMRPLTGADVLPNQDLAFKPGGNHAMLFGVDPAVKPGDPLTLHFSFQSGTTIDVAAKTLAAGDDMPTEHEAH